MQQDAAAALAKLSQVHHHVPMLALRSGVMFPGIRVYVELPQRTADRALALLRRSRAGGIGLMALQPGAAAGARELLPVGTFCQIVSVARTAGQKGSSGGVRLCIEGLARLRVLRFVQMDPPFQVCAVRFVEDEVPDGGSLAMQRLVLQVQKELLGLLPMLQAPDPLPWPSTPALLADAAGAVLGPGLSLQEWQNLLETANVQARLELVLWWLKQRGAALSFSAGKGLRWPTLCGEFELRSVRRVSRGPRGAGGTPGRGAGAEAPGQDAALDEEGEEEEEEDVSARLGRLLEAGSLPADAGRVALRELRRLKALDPSHSEYIGLVTFLETMASLPWQASTQDPLDLASARALLDAEHCGLECAKRRILEFLAVQQLGGSGRGPILCLDGPPGVGKTSLGQSVAKALGRKFHRIALGGMRDEAGLRGHRRTYIGSSPGAIIQGLQVAGVNNPVFLLDEVDKLVSNSQFNPQAVLLEVLDPEQNSTFRDHYLNTAFDLSRVLFICTSNDLSQVDRPLLDRLEVMQVPGYTPEEQVNIARTHLLPKQLRLHGLAGAPSGRSEEAERSAETSASDPPVSLLMSDKALEELVRGYSDGGQGVRDLERLLGHVCRWAVMHLLKGGAAAPVHVAAGDLAGILGGPARCAGVAAVAPLESGEALGLVHTSHGAQVRSFEVSLFAGAGGFTVTGRVGPVAKESMLTAATVAKNWLAAVLDPASAPGRAAEAWFRGREDLHLHVPSSPSSGGGPVRDSAAQGLPVLLALTSALLRRPLPRRCAAAGELTLRGALLPVPDLRELLAAARRAGLEEVLLPEGCRAAALEELTDAARSQVRVVFVKDAGEALRLMFPVDEASCIVVQDIEAPMPASRL